MASAQGDDRCLIAYCHSKYKQCSSGFSTGAMRFCLCELPSAELLITGSCLSHREAVTLSRGCSLGS